MPPPGSTPVGCWVGRLCLQGFHPGDKKGLACGSGLGGILDSAAPLEQREEGVRKDPGTAETGLSWLPGPPGVGGGTRLRGWSSLVLPGDLRLEPNPRVVAEPPAPAGYEVQDAFIQAEGGEGGAGREWVVCREGGAGRVGGLVLEAVEQLAGLPL